MRARICRALLGVTVLVLGTGCSDSDSSSSDGGTNGETGGGSSGGLDWHSSSCDQLGGVTTPLGACLVDCSGTCPTTQTECEQMPGLRLQCRVPSCSVDTDCGPQGWYCREGHCSLTCTTVSGGAQSSECAVGWECYAPDYGDDRRPYCAYGVSSGNDCGSCGTDNAGNCCGGVFCDGACLGSPCC